MSGAIPLLPLYGFMVWTGMTLPLPTFFGTELHTLSLSDITSNLITISMFVTADLKTVFHTQHKKGKAACIHAANTYSGNRGTAPLIHNLGTRWK
jgi:hypothetical protein